MSESFEYSSIPVGYYDEVFRNGHPIRRAWHVEKFERVLDCLPLGSNQSLLDIGCFAGTFLSTLPEEKFSRQLGVDIIRDQIEFSNQQFGNQYREFRHIDSLLAIKKFDEQFDCVTMIEVIEHLTKEEIRSCFRSVAKVLKPGGMFVFSTPNYCSAWPLLEVILNKTSDVSYVDQHITKFHYFNMITKLAAIYPDLLSEFEVTFKTTTHFISPFLAVFGIEFAKKIGRLVDHKSWKFPFGNLIVVGLSRRT